MRRLACDRRVFFVEDPRATRGRARVSMRTGANEVEIVSTRGLADEEMGAVVRSLAQRANVVAPVVWIYSPRCARAALALSPSVVVYDCIDDLKGDHALLSRADLVFTASDALFEDKRVHNVSTYPVPNGVDVDHFAPARRSRNKANMRPRAGVLGAIDARLDLDLLDRIAAHMPELVIELVGPLHVSRDALPARPNVRWLGPLRYDVLPALLATWDVALVPWRAGARVEPTSVLACAAAGLPVVSTPIDAVARRHGGKIPVLISSRETFGSAIDAALAFPRDVQRIAIDALLARTSWDRSVKVMTRLLAETEMAKGLSRLRHLALA